MPWALEATASRLWLREGKGARGVARAEAQQAVLKGGVGWGGDVLGGSIQGLHSSR